ncbi:MAG: tetratricopeptide repeat protein, partial [Myxococcota bacterium]
LRLRFGDGASARPDLEAAAALAQRAGDAGIEALARVRLGELANVTDGTAAAAPWFDEARALARSVGDVRVECLAVLGQVDGATGASAEARAEEALVLARRIGDLGLEAVALGKLGIAAFVADQRARARELHQRAAALARRVGHRDAEATAIGNLANTFNGHDPASAIHWYEAALDAFRQIGNIRLEALARTNLGGQYVLLGEADRGRAVLEDALAAIGPLRMPHAEAMVRANLGVALGDLGRPDEAIAQLERSLALAAAAPGNTRAVIGDASITLAQLEPPERAEARLAAIERGGPDGMHDYAWHRLRLRRAILRASTDPAGAAATLAAVERDIAAGPPESRSFRLATDLDEARRVIRGELSTASSAAAPISPPARGTPG